MQTSNPAFTMNKDLLSHFDHASTRSNAMTVQGTAIKSMLLLGILGTAAAWSWNTAENGQFSAPLLIGSLVVGGVLSLATIFKPMWAMWTAPFYAAAEGVLLGAISQQVDIRSPGIALQAVAVTGGVTFTMLLIYATGLIKVTGQLAGAIAAATGAIALVYLISMAVSLFGGRFPYIHDAGPVGIGFSVFVVGLAAFNLLLDFDFIERSSAAEAPKAMEWYGAFGLMVTLVWLYVEVLNLLRKLQDRR